MNFKNINLTKVIVKESFGPYNINSNKEKAIIIPTILIILFYLSSIVWFLIKRNMPIYLNNDFLIIIGVFIFLFFSITYFLVRLPLKLFDSSSDRQYFYLPIKMSKVVLFKFKSMFLLQLLFSLILFIPLIISIKLSIALYIYLLVIVNLIVLTFDYFLGIILFILAIFLPRKFINLIFPLISVSGVIFVGTILNKYGYRLYEVLPIESLTYKLSYKYIVFMIFVVILCCSFLFLLNWFSNKYFKKIYLNINVNSIINYKKIFKLKKIKNEYIFIEYLFLWRNKKFLLFSLMRTVLLVIIISRLFMSTFNKFLKDDMYFSIITIIILISSFNLFNVTAYSRDLKQLDRFNVLPIKKEKIFYNKVLVSFLINIILSLIILIIAIISFNVFNFKIVSIFLFIIIYSLISSILGVLMDKLSPIKEYDSINELVRNNYNSIIMFLLGIVFTAIIYISQKIFGVYFIDIINIILLIFIWLLNNTIKKRSLYD
ncbi:MAG: hypothetical protein ACTHVE_06775 [Senegalia sp. (in: firmicutes)]|uniref:hypothetical protein n=1 Tax=Bacillota TaxID=1239 RepID=UPI003F9CD139